jgi:hypothetical protein
MEDEAETGKGEDVDAKKEKLMDWLLSTDLTWAVLILTCFIGLIELLPEIRYYGSSHGDVGLTCLLALVALVLVGGCIFSIDKFARLTNTRVLLEQEFSETVRRTFHGTKGGFIYNVLFKNG